MATIVIDTTNYASYASVDEADAYLKAASHAANWEAATLLQKQQALVTATRLFDRQSWLPTYNTFALRLAVASIVEATIELALALIDGETVQSASTTGSDIASMSAGSVSISFRRMASGQVATRFPLIVQELLRAYLEGAGVGSYVSVSGVDAESIFPLSLGVRA